MLYVGTNTQVQEDHGDDSDDEDEEGAHLHDDLVHHDHEADGEYYNDQWAWMQTEIQRQGAEISRLRGDVQRGNHMHEQSYRMLLRMVQHLNF